MDEELVEVPLASSAKDLNRLAELTQGLSPEQVAELNHELILMPRTTNMDINLGWDLEQVAQIFQEALVPEIQDSRLRKSILIKTI
jgi:hypothetical protein